MNSWEGSTAEELATVWCLPAVVLFESVDSTNDVARDLAASGAPSGTTVLAERQRAGRGRAGRSWESPAGLGLWLSMIGRPHRDDLQPLPIRVGVALATALDPWTGAGATRVKWPNDLLVGGRKVAGILCEASWAGNVLDHVVVGVGLNVLHAETDFPPELRSTATSVAASTGLGVSRYEVATAVVAAMLEALDDPGLGGAVRDDLQGRDALGGEWVEVREPETDRLIASGRAMGIDPQGRLRLGTSRGEVSITSGTVRVRGSHP